MLRMSIKKIKKAMEVEKDYKSWINIGNTNCYAYALGLDIPEWRIHWKAYNLGYFALFSKYKKEDELKTYEDRLIADLEFLNIDYDVCLDIGYHCDFDPCYEKHRDILFFQKLKCGEDSDFHFARYGKDGKLYHKKGWGRDPLETTIEDIEKDGYKFSKRYRLYLDRK